MLRQKFAVAGGRFNSAFCLVNVNGFSSNNFHGASFQVALITFSLPIRLT
jgi:hypothetical protein